MAATPLAYTQDFALAQRVMEGEARAEKQLAQRLIVRVRRAAHALMGGAPEADDAAQHALIELLRSIRTYPGETSLESWADRRAARSLVRFARAVRARKATLEPGPFDRAAGARHVAEAERPERYARTLEEFLRELPSAPREALLLREAFGFDLVETAQLMRTSTRATREHLSRARGSLYLRSLKGGDESSDLEAIERWFALRDRADVMASPGSAAGSGNTPGPAPGSQAGELSAVEQEELSALEAQPELRKVQKELRALPQFVEGGRFGRLSQQDKRLSEGALAAVRVSAISSSSALPREAAREVTPEEPDGGWVHAVSIGLCVALVLGAFLALALRTPAVAVRGGSAHTAAAGHTESPTVEALSSAHAVERGAPLSRAGEPLREGASLREGDVVSAQTLAGCFGLSPRADVCLSSGSAARISQLSLSARRIELLRGRAVVSVERVTPPVPLALSVNALRAETTDGVLGFELDRDQVFVRVLRGTALIATPGGSHALASGQSAIYASATGQLEVVPQLSEKARRDWDLLATRAGGQPAARNSPSARPEPVERSAPSPGAEPAPAPTETASGAARGGPAAEEEAAALPANTVEAANVPPAAEPTPAATPEQLRARQAVEEVTR